MYIYIYILFIYTYIDIDSKNNQKQTLDTVWKHDHNMMVNMWGSEDLAADVFTVKSWSVILLVS